ncbi:MAG: hypothetical protein J6A89_01170 [Clostridia bacterium]|nr:hypothetical protein [Clostridia bacterium]
MKTKIREMYFNEQKKPVEIAKELQIPKYTVTRVLQKDARYLEEKQKRKAINKINHINKTKEYIKNKRKIIQFQNKVDNLILKHMHNQASFELSKGRKLSNMAYRNWNISAYSYDSNRKRFVFKSELGRSSDVPKYIKL